MKEEQTTEVNVMDSIDAERRKREWDAIENDVTEYKLKLKENATKEDKKISEKAAERLLTKFDPLFKKYILLFKTGQIDFNDNDIKSFVRTFISDPRLHRALNRTRSRSEFKSDIFKKFCFIIETYGQLPEEDMLIDLQICLLVLASRYKPMGRNFCAYVHNSFRFEVSRHVKKYIKNPINISYKNMAYEDEVNGEQDTDLERTYEDVYYEDETGIPNANWISGQTCSELFNDLSPLERKIIVKYYAEEMNDKQIAGLLKLHINTINQKRRAAVKTIASNYGIDLEKVKKNRHRHSGKNIEI